MDRINLLDWLLVAVSKSRVIVSSRTFEDGSEGRFDNVVDADALY